MYTKLFLPVLLATFCLSTAFAQSESTVITHDKKATVNLSGVARGLYPYIRHYGQPNFNHQTERHKHYSLQKDNVIPRSKIAKISGTVPPPTIDISFDGQGDFNFTPTDNEIAVSNDGKVVSVYNSEIHVYDEQGTRLEARSLRTFSEPLGVTGVVYDPRILYDPLADRFILVFLAGNHSFNSNLMLAFTQTSDPAGDWHVYNILGNMLSDSSWVDYPIIGISKSDLFVSLTAIADGANIFKGVRLIQLNKSDGYQGKTLNTLLHHGFGFEEHLWMDGDFLKVTPVQGGVEPYGPHMYFLSARDFHPQNDTLYLMEITDSVGSGNIQVNWNTIITDVPYTFPPYAAQKNTSIKLRTNHNTIMSAFYVNDQIQFVKNDAHPDSGTAAIYHGFIDDVGGANTATGMIITDDSLELSFPSITYTGIATQVDEAFMVFNTSSKNHNPGHAVLYYKEGAYSEIVRIIEGMYYLIDLQMGIARWGDYTGCQAKYNDPGKVWLTGSYGDIFEAGTWISSVSLEQGPPASDKRSAKDKALQPVAKVYPNPAPEHFELEFNAPISEFYSFELYDIQGKLISTLIEDRIKAGINRLYFSTRDLDNGVYILQVGRAGETMLSRKVVVQH